jgi:D-aspartate ligase
MSMSAGPKRLDLESRPQPAPAGALVLGGAHGSLAVVRSLGRRGIPVWFMTHNHPIAGLSRYARRRFFWPGPAEKDAIQYLIDFIRDHHLEGWVLIACGDAELRLVSQHHSELSKLVRVTAQPWQIVEIACNKTKTYQQAEAAGVDFPRCYQVRDRAELLALDCKFPVVMKPADQNTVNAFTAAKAWKAEDRSELIRRYDQARALVGEGGIVLQEFIPGTGDNQFSYAAVWNEGKPVASLVARRGRQYPVEFGFTSTFVECVDNSAVESAATRFLRSLNYSGIVELEFKYDSRDNRYKLLDFNARVWTWIALGAAAGVDFPYLLWLGQGSDNGELVRGRLGATWMHAARDLASASHLMMRGTLTPVGYLRSLRLPITFAAFALDDLLPGLVDLPMTLYRVLIKRRAFKPKLYRPFKSAVDLLTNVGAPKHPLP